MLGAGFVPDQAGEEGPERGFGGWQVQLLPRDERRRVDVGVEFHEPQRRRAMVPRHRPYALPDAQPVPRFRHVHHAPANVYATGRRKIPAGAQSLHRPDATKNAHPKTGDGMRSVAKRVFDSSLSLPGDKSLRDSSNIRRLSSTAAS